MTPQRKLILAIVIFGLISVGLIVAAVVLKVSDDAAKNAPVNQNTYVDPDTGETVLYPEGKATEGLGSQGTVVLGLSKLLDAGLSSDQVEGTRLYLIQYAADHTINNQKMTEFSIVSSTIKQAIYPGGKKIVTADLRINRKDTQQLRLTYFYLTDLTLDILDLTSGAVVFSATSNE